jgi:hypothetical protein
LLCGTQFVQGRQPFAMSLPLPLPTVRALKQRVHAEHPGALSKQQLRVHHQQRRRGGRAQPSLGKPAFADMLCTDLPPERQRLVFAGQILAAPDDLLSDVRVRERRAAWFARFAADGTRCSPRHPHAGFRQRLVCDLPRDDSAPLIRDVRERLCIL